MKYFSLTLALLFSGHAAAQDSWTGHDKQLHFLVSAGFGVASGAYFESKWTAFGVAMLPGLAKEIIDSRSEGNKFSGKDIVANAVGAGLGVQLGAWGRKSQARTARSMLQIQRGATDPAQWGLRAKSGGLMLTWGMGVEL